MKTNNNSIVALEVRINDSNYSGIGMYAHDAETIRERVSKFLSVEQAERIQRIDAPDEDLRAVPLEEGWYYILTCLQII